MFIQTSNIRKIASKLTCLCVVVAAVQAEKQVAVDLEVLADLNWYDAVVADQHLWNSSDTSPLSQSAIPQDTVGDGDQHLLIETSGEADTTDIDDAYTDIDDTYDYLADIDVAESDSAVVSSDSGVFPHTEPIGIYALDVVVESPNGGRVEGHEPDSKYPPDRRVVLTAIANAGYEFAGWSSDGDITTDDNLAAVVMDGDRIVTAKFAPTAVQQSVSAGQSKLTVGPNPVPGDNSSVSLYWSGGEIRNAALSVYDVAGVLIYKLSLKDPDAGFSKRGYTPMGTRRVGEWALKDKDLRPVPPGTYLVRGTITTVDGSRERVSLPVSVK